MQIRSPGPNHFLVPLILFLFIAGGLLASHFVSPILAFAVLTLALVGVMLIGQPSVLLWSALAFFLIRPLLGQYTGSYFTLMDEAVYAMCMLITAVNAVFRRFTWSAQERRFFAIFIGVCVVAVLSGLFHQIPLINLVQFLKSYLGFGFVFLLGIKVLSGRDAKPFFFGSVIFILVQTVLNIGWMFRINPLRNTRWYSSFDFGQGTLGWADHVAYVYVFFIVVLYVVFNDLMASKQRVLMILLLGVSMVGFSITHTIHAYFLIVLGLGAFYVLSFRRIRNKALPIILVIIFVPVILILKNMTSSSMQGGRSEDFDKQNLQYRYEGLLQGGKGQTYVNTFWNLPNEQAINWVIGAGPGQYMSTIAMVRPTALTYKYMGQFYLTHTGRNDMIGGSITQSPIVGICTLFGELGTLGLIGYLALYLLPVQRVLRNLRRNQYADFYQRILAQAFAPCIIVFFTINFLRDMWPTEHFVFFLWIWAAIVWEPISSKSDGQMAEV